MTSMVSVPVTRKPPTDQQLAQQIRNQLAADSRASAGLKVDVLDGVVMLRGTATSFYQKQLWLHGTKRVTADDAEIIDQIQVIPNADTSDMGWRD